MAPLCLRNVNRNGNPSLMFGFGLRRTGLQLKVLTRMQHSTCKRGSSEYVSFCFQLVLFCSVCKDYTNVVLTVNSKSSFCLSVDQPDNSANNPAVSLLFSPEKGEQM